ncbi:uncharacterized protein ARMOST_00965 [Armillaria ostoyae]|uniref:Uncharacterized protein n=1 Tax=Armillaria ostoyae TaxID=47428 RepID=A0A284QMK3_ARMOS|nr:uncharacterized protein ARMOST_00965 [Armillaria ostoyae]
MPGCRTSNTGNHDIYGCDGRSVLLLKAPSTAVTVNFPYPMVVAIKTTRYTLHRVLVTATRSRTCNTWFKLQNNREIQDVAFGSSRCSQIRRQFFFDRSRGLQTWKESPNNGIYSISSVNRSSDSLANDEYYYGFQRIRLIRFENIVLRASRLLVSNQAVFERGPSEHPPLFWVQYVPVTED